MISKRNDKVKFGIIALYMGLGSIVVPPFLLHVRYRLYLFMVLQIFSWIIPFFMALKIEKNKIDSLGIVFQRERLSSYFIYSIIGFIIMTLLLGFEITGRIYLAGESSEKIFSYRSNLLVALLIQLGGVGLPEELFFRGYLMTRFCRWLGNSRGLWLNCLVFGLVHVTSRVSQFGFGYSLSALLIGIQAFFAGLIFGIQYLKTKSIFPPVMTHIALNMFSVRILALILG